MISSLSTMSKQTQNEIFQSSRQCAKRKRTWSNSSSESDIENEPRNEEKRPRVEDAEDSRIPLSEIPIKISPSNIREGSSNEQYENVNLRIRPNNELTVPDSSDKSSICQEYSSELNDAFDLNDDYETHEAVSEGSCIISTSEGASSSPIAQELLCSDSELSPIDDNTVTWSHTSENAPQEKTTLTYMGQLTPATPCNTWSSFRKLSVGASIDSNSALCPIPDLPWTSNKVFWEVMCEKDESSVKIRNPDLFDYQPFLQPKMRAILLDWISEVAEVYKLHRETYYLAMDYIDRYLSVVEKVQRTQLQLLGVTCLFIASKMEEIYPPKIESFSSVTDGACTEEEIYAMEITVLMHLDWNLSPMTVNGWLEMILQFVYRASGNTDCDNMLVPHFSGILFKKFSQLIDLATLDVASLQFSYGVIAATAVYILVDPSIALNVSGLERSTIEPCVKWMSVYWDVLCSKTPSKRFDVHNLPKGRPEQFLGDNSCTRQTHTTSIELYDLAQIKLEEIDAAEETLKNTSHLLTPPSSSSKVAYETCDRTPVQNLSLP